MPLKHQKNELKGGEEKNKKRKVLIGNVLPRGNSKLQFLGVLLGVFGIFLLWSGYKAFEANPSYLTGTAMSGFIGGGLSLLLAYLFLRE